MGTSSSNGGQGNSTPLVPTWLGEPSSSSPQSIAGLPPSVPPDDVPSFPDGSSNLELLYPSDVGTSTQPSSIQSVVTPIQSPARINFPRFNAARSNFTRFAKSGGRNRRSLGRALSTYVRTSSGGSKTAARRMATSRDTAVRLASFLGNVSTQGARAALASVNLETLAGRPIGEIFLALTDIVCPAGGTLDEGIARDAFIETVAGLLDSGLSDLDDLSPNQLNSILEGFIAHSIEDRIMNDVGSKTIALPKNLDAVTAIQTQLHDFVLNAVHDSFDERGTEWISFDPNSLKNLIQEIYTASFELIAVMAEELIK